MVTDTIFSRRSRVCLPPSAVVQAEFRMMRPKFPHRKVQVGIGREDDEDVDDSAD
jgi:hypothetical protein